jgi:hypothetical protein
VTKATAVADALADVLEAKRLYSDIKGKKYVRVEGWTMLGSMLGVFPVCLWTKPIEGGWEARVEARTLAGQVVGAAEASCLRGEANWKSRDDFALRSMAQTRATAKALRLPLGFVVALAGYEATPAEEMVEEARKVALASPQAVPEASEEDLVPALEASIEAVKARTLFVGEAARSDMQEAADDALAAKDGQTCPECNGELGAFVSKQGVPYLQCKWGHDLYFQYIDKGKTKQQAAALTRGHFYEIIP